MDAQNEMWLDLMDYVGSTGWTETEALRRRGEALLEEALTCGTHTDVLFELDDGSKLIGGHRAHLCVALPGMQGMLEEDSVVRMRGFHAAAVKGLLEWVYLGEWMLVRISSTCVCWLGLECERRAGTSSLARKACYLW
jgi:hypothetical protein